VSPTDNAAVCVSSAHVVCVAAIVQVTDVATPFT
jgi:hypothetical protein